MNIKSKEYAIQRGRSRIKFVGFQIGDKVFLNGRKSPITIVKLNETYAECNGIRGGEFTLSNDAFNFGRNFAVYDGNGKSYYVIRVERP